MEIVKAIKQWVTARLYQVARPFTHSSLCLVSSAWTAAHSVFPNVVVTNEIKLLLACLIRGLTHVQNKGAQRLNNFILSQGVCLGKL